MESSLNSAVTLPPPPGATPEETERLTGFERLPPTTPFRATLPPEPPQETRVPAAALELTGVIAPRGAAGAQISQAHRRAETQASVPRAMRAAEVVSTPGFGDLDIAFPSSMPASSPSRATPPPTSHGFDDEPGSASFSAVLPDAAPTARGREIAFAPPASNAGGAAEDEDEIPAVFGTPTFKTRADASAASAPATERAGRGAAPRMRRSEPPDVASPAAATRALDELTSGKHRMPRAPGEAPPPTVRAGKKPPSTPPAVRARDVRSDPRIETRDEARNVATRQDKDVSRRDSGRDGRSAFAAVDEVVANLKKDPRSE